MSIDVVSISKTLRKRITSNSKFLINSLHIICERAKIVAIEDSTANNIPIDPKYLEINDKNEEARSIARTMLYSQSAIDLESDNVRAMKFARKLFVDECNSAAAFLIQFDNALEQLFSYLAGTPERTPYKKVLAECGVLEVDINSVFIPLRSLRNTMCHSYAFHNTFGEMTVGKLSFLKVACFKARKLSFKYLGMAKVKQLTSVPGFVLFLNNDLDIITNKTTRWYFL